MNQDNTVRFTATDTTDMDSYSLKLYFKGKASEGKFYAQEPDPTFTSSISDCKNYRVINNRLYDKPAKYDKPITVNDKPLYDDIKLPQCVTVPDNGSLKTNYINVFTLPEGVRLDKKCLKGDMLTKQNSCIPFLRNIGSGILHALKVLNMGTSFFKHGNVFPHNMYLLVKNDTQRVFLDNMLFDNNKYDDISQKPFKSDMNMLGDAFIKLLTGTEKIVVKDVTSTFEVYHSIKKYFMESNININLKSSALNSPSNIKEGNGKCITKAELDYKLQKSIFNFIYRLKCTGTNPVNQFIDIDQAINHDFIKSAAKQGADSWDSLPADY